MTFHPLLQKPPSAPSLNYPYPTPRPVAKSSPAKLSVECPHCGFKQMEYAAAKTTMCRQCGRSFAPGTPKPALRPTVPSASSAPNESSSAREPFGLGKIEGLWNRQRNRVVACFEC